MTNKTIYALDSNKPNRVFYGIEKNKEYFNEAVQRWEKITGDKAKAKYWSDKDAV